MIQLRSVSTYAPKLERGEEGWRLSAACLGVTSEFFFIEAGGSVAEAKTVCKGCPVRVACLRDAMAVEDGAGRSERHGVYGGLVPEERWRLYQRGWKPGDPVPRVIFARGGSVPG